MITSWTSAHRNVGCGLIAALALSAQAEGAAAQAEVVRAQLIVDADERCATAGAIEAQVRKRSQRIEFGEGQGEPTRLRVAISGDARGERVVELAVLWPDGRRSERRLTAASCEAAVEALGLLVAMALDPAALAAPAERGATRSSAPAAPAPAGETAPPRGSPAGDDATAEAESAANAADAPSTGAPEASSAAQEQQPASEAAEAAPSARASQAPRGPGSSSAPPSAHDPHPLGVRHAVVGASAQLVSGPAPRIMPGLGLSAGLALNGAGAWAPAVELRLSHAWLSGLAEAGGNADFALYAAQLDLCPLGVRFPPFSARACAGAAVGRLSARGSNSYLPQAHSLLWATLGGGLLASLGLGRWLELQAGFGLDWPLRRYRFAFRPDVFHRVASPSWQGRLGAGLRFP